MAALYDRRRAHAAGDPADWLGRLGASASMVAAGLYLVCTVPNVNVRPAGTSTNHLVSAFRKREKWGVEGMREGW